MLCRHDCSRVQRRQLRRHDRCCFPTAPSPTSSCTSMRRRCKTPNMLSSFGMGRACLVRTPRSGNVLTRSLWQASAACVHHRGDSPRELLCTCLCLYTCACYARRKHAFVSLCTPPTPQWHLASPVPLSADQHGPRHTSAKGRRWPACGGGKMQRPPSSRP